MMAGHETYHHAWFDIAGLSEDRYEVITTAVKFKKVIVPDQTFFALSGVAHPKWLTYFDLIKERVSSNYPKSSIKKIYLTRTQLKSKKDQEINEKYYEDFYREKGFAIISPEKLPLGEQINLIMNASELATTLGTLSHMTVFASNGAQCAFLLRNPSTILRPQILIDLLKKHSTYYIEATKSILPSPHEKGVPLYLSTKYFERYTTENGITNNRVDEHDEIQTVAY